jgi:hypothetical protein
MSKQGEKLAQKMASRIMRESGVINKSYGGRQEVASMISPVAEAIVMLREQVKRYDKATEKLLAAQGERLTEIGGRWQEAGRGFTDFVPSEFELRKRADGMVQRSMRTMNGHGPVVTEDNTGVPQWHPES